MSAAGRSESGSRSVTRAEGGRGVADRQAALELHRLGREDRTWILSQLAPDERDRVSRLLGELDAMEIRIELDDATLADARKASPFASAMNGSDPAHGQPATPAAALQRATPERVVAVLAGEPPWVAANVLGNGLWPWVRDVRAALARQRGPAFGAELRTSPTPPALAAAIESRLAAKLAADEIPLDIGTGERTNGHAYNGSVLRRLFSGVRQWLR